MKKAIIQRPWIALFTAMLTALSATSCSDSNRKSGRENAQLEQRGSEQSRPEGVSEAAQKGSDPDGFVGSQACKRCHDHFHELWATSRHGLAMQKLTGALAEKEFTFDDAEIKIGDRSYRAVLRDGKLEVVERAP